MKNILLVDDDTLLRQSLAFTLEQAGYHASTSGNAEDALVRSRANPPDLVLLDIGLPGMDGLEALRYFREEIHVPVIFLTGRQRGFDEVLGLELGAEDYITKPFEPDVLLARIKTTLRRSTFPKSIPQRPDPVTIGDLQINPDEHTVTIGGKLVDLTPIEFSLLYILASEAGNVVTINELLNRVWGEGYVGEPQVIYVHVRWLREKIELDPNNPKRILNVRGIGYKMAKE